MQKRPAELTNTDYTTPKKSKPTCEPYTSTPLDGGGEVTNGVEEDTNSTYVSYRYRKGQKGQFGSTPNKQNVIRLDGEQGSSHPHIKSPGETNYQEGQFLYHKSYNGQRGALLAELIALHYRIEEDYKSRVRDSAHYETTYFKIQLCKHLLQRILTNFPNEAQQTIVFFNKALRTKRFPDLDPAERIYELPNHEHYDEGAYQDLYKISQPLTLDKIKNYTPNLLAVWLKDYRHFQVNIVDHTTPVPRRRRGQNTKVSPDMQKLMIINQRQKGLLGVFNIAQASDECDLSSRLLGSKDTFAL